MRRWLWLLCTAAACASRPEPPPAPPSAPPQARVAPAPSAPAEINLGVGDRGIFSDLDGRVQIAAPAAAHDAMLLVDRRRALAVLYVQRWPRKVYPLGGVATVPVGGETLRLRPGDASEIAALAPRLERLEAGAPPPGDHDDDGIPDPLDVLIGAHKAALNGAEYDDGYFVLGFPGGDPPRNRGACVDVIVRATRNAGLDLQAAVFQDMRAAGSVYGKGRPDPNIDHRRVRTILVYLRRHWRAHSPALDDPNDPLRVGDVVLFDTFANRPGPDHIGVVSELAGDGGLPLVINNWTFGYTTRPMDLLAAVPVTHRFRFPSRSSE